MQKNRFIVLGVLALALTYGLVLAGCEDLNKKGGSGELTWTKVESSKFENYQDIKGIAYGGGKFVAIGQYGKIAYSTNGTDWTVVTWTEGNPNPFSSNGSDIKGIAYDGGKFVVVGSSKIATSENGADWTAVDDSKFQCDGYNYNDDINGIAYGGGKFVAVGDNGVIIYSNDQE
jgi:hypothetical protein